MGVKPGQIYRYRNQYLYVILEIEPSSPNNNLRRVSFLMENKTVDHWSLTAKIMNDISLFEHNMGWQHVL